MSPRDTLLSRDAESRRNAPAVLPREVAARSAEPGMEIDCVVCIPAFRRPDHLRRTLASIEAQVTARRFAVVIAENDARDRASAAEAERFFASSRIPGLCVVERNQGNCNAINAAFETARVVFMGARFFLMIDDDEIASPDWLDHIVTAAETTGADVVGGPVFPDFVVGASNNLGEHPAFRPAYDRTGPVPVIYGSGNCLIARHVFERLDDPTFNLRFNFLGGGDTDFFARCRAAGLRFFWNAEAEIRETVPAQRTKLGWLLRRGLRIGAINFHVQWRTSNTLLSRLKLTAKMLLLFPASLVRTVTLLASGRTLLHACHPVIVAVGSALASIGIEPHQYKA